MEEDPCDICGGTHVGLCPDDPSEKEIFITKTGRVLTDEEIEKMADEAERGYDVRHLEAKQGKLPDRKIRHRSQW